MPLQRSPTHPFAREGIIQRILPFGGVALLALALVPLPPAEYHPLSLSAAAILFAITLGAAFFAPWDRLPTFAQAFPPFAFLPAVAFLRHAEGGGASGYAPLVLVPVIWLALYGNRQQLASAVGIAGVCLSVPIIVSGAPLYPASEWRRMSILIVISGVVGATVQRLVRRQEELSDQLTELALADSLTELPNRRAWDERLRTELARADRNGGVFSVALIDLDNFKRFNDEFGHPAGDELLQACALAWLGELRVSDVLARYGGEEFAVLLPDCALDSAVETAERLRSAMPAGQTCSIGVAELDPGEDGGNLIARADSALYAAKAAGRDLVEAARPTSSTLYNAALSEAGEHARSRASSSVV